MRVVASAGGATAPPRRRTRPRCRLVARPRKEPEINGAKPQARPVMAYNRVRRSAERHRAHRDIAPGKRCAGRHRVALHPRGGPGRGPRFDPTFIRRGSAISTPKRKPKRPRSRRGGRRAAPAGLQARISRAMPRRPVVWTSIVAAADEVDARVVVVGSRGRSGHALPVLGSVSNAGVRRSHRHRAGREPRTRCQRGSASVVVSARSIL